MDEIKPLKSDKDDNQASNEKPEDQSDGNRGSNENAENQSAEQEKTEKKSENIFKKKIAEEKKKKRVKGSFEEMAKTNDFVLAGKKHYKKPQEDFIKELKEKKIEVESEERNGYIFYGLKATNDFIKEHLFDKSDNIDVESISKETRIAMLNTILSERKETKKFLCFSLRKDDNTEVPAKSLKKKLKKLKKKEVFDKKFCSNPESKRNMGNRLLNEMAQGNDFVLVGKMDKKDQQDSFINELKAKHFQVNSKEFYGKYFYGLRAQKEALEDYQHLFESITGNGDDVEIKRRAARIRIVNSILNEIKTNAGEDLENLMMKDVFKTKFSLDEAFLMECYYILVGVKGEEKEQEDFIKELKTKQIEVQKINGDKKVFYGLRAKEELFKDYQHLLNVSDTSNSDDTKATVSLATRIRVVHFIVNETKVKTEEGKELTMKHVFETNYCLHEENDRRELKKWANWKTTFINQPMKKIRKHFGEKVALYYLWLRWYTLFLIPAAVVGLLVILCGIAFLDTNIIIKEVCESNVTMCPLCDKRCLPWSLNTTCTYAKINYLFDNTATVVFAVFMAMWSTSLLELWKRHRAKHVSKWRVYDWCEEEEELILEIVNNSDCEPKTFKHNYIRSTLILILASFVMLLIVEASTFLVLFRVRIRPYLSESRWQLIRDYTNTLVMILGAGLHYITIQIMTRVNRHVSLILSKWESPNSRSEREKTFTIMMFTFQFFTLFSSLFYIAFFLGRINGHPGNYVRIFGQRLEECHPSGCLTDLFIQMAVIMTLSQVINNIFAIVVPWLRNKWRKVMVKNKKLDVCCLKFSIPWPKENWWKRDNGQTDKDDGREGHEMCLIKKCEDCLLKDWQKDYNLADTDEYTLFYEILSKVIQFSFTTLFVAAFPLAPLVALINNIIEIHLDAFKMVQLQRLLIPKKTNVMGVWTNVLEAIGVLAVITNGLVIGITSDFIPRIVYLFGYSPCSFNLKAQIHNKTQCMSGYINSTLITAYMNNSDIDQFVPPDQSHLFNVTACRYRDFRDITHHAQTSQFWWVLAARFTFVIVFEHLLLLFKSVAIWFFPSDSLSAKTDRQKSKLERLKEEIEKKPKQSNQSQQNVV